MSNPQDRPNVAEPPGVQDRPCAASQPVEEDPIVEIVPADLREKICIPSPKPYDGRRNAEDVVL